MQFTTIDFETANERRDSACAVAVAVVEDGIQIRTKAWLIQPEPLEFSAFNTMLHGINAELVSSAPLFPEVWAELEHFLNGSIVLAHNAPFDMSVLRRLLHKYDVEHSPIPYFCTREMSKAAFPGSISYSLSVMTDRLGIHYANPHDPVWDAAACAEVALKCCEELQADSIESFLNSQSIACGEINQGSYTPWRYPQSSGVHPRNLRPESPDFDPSHPFFEKTVVFTGTLSGMPRVQAMQKVVNLGGECSTSVSKATDYLVVGEQDFRKFRGGDKSAKMKKVETLLSKGVSIEILSESEFMQLL